MGFGGTEPVSGCFLEFLTQKGNEFSSLWCAWDDQAQISTGATWLNTRAGGIPQAFSGERRRSQTWACDVLAVPAPAELS